jgi:cytochrome P450
VLLIQLTLPEYLLQYYSPMLTSIVAKISGGEKYAELVTTYVLETAKKANPAPFTLISRLQSKAAELPERTVPAECMDHLVAGIDTTGDGLCFLMHELSLPRSQYAQMKLQKELLENPGTPFDQLPYLDAVVKEGLRCFPPIPMSFPRYVPAGGRTISGFWVPEGTIVSAQPFTLHKDERVFPRSLEYEPERWLSEKGASDREEMYFAFSKGSRGCLGRK